MRDLREGSIGTRVQRLEREATNLKASQFTGGDSIRTYLIQTTRSYDLTYTSVNSEQDCGVFVKFTADHQDAPFAQATMDILIDNNVNYKVGILEFGGGKSDNGVVTNGWVKDVFGNDSPTGQPNKKNELSWYNSIKTYGVGKNIKVKFKVYSTDTGRLIVKYQTNGGSGFVIQ